ncbi:MAG: hypothetical protein GW939_00455 [Candidatus Magasanikbacteria bacterium]|nr:hypothetical protein [Candidatus Magasanikbacteria bacterium]
MKEEDAGHQGELLDSNELTTEQKDELRNQMALENDRIKVANNIPQQEEKRTWRDLGILAGLNNARNELLRDAFDTAKNYQEVVKQFVSSITHKFTEEQTARWIKNTDAENQNNAEKNVLAALDGIKENAKQGDLEMAMTMQKDLKEYTEEPVRFYTKIKKEQKLNTDKKNYTPRQQAIESQLQKLRGDMLNGDLQAAIDKEEKIKQFCEQFKEGLTDDIRKKYVHNDAPEKQRKREQQIQGIANQIDQALQAGNIDQAEKLKQDFENTVGMYDRYVKSLEKKYLADINKKKKRTDVEQQVLHAVSTIRSKLAIGRLDEIDPFIQDMEDYLEPIREQKAKQEKQTDTPEKTVETNQPEKIDEPNEKKPEKNTEQVEMTTKKMIEQYIQGNIEPQTLNQILTHESSPIADALLQELGGDPAIVKKAFIDMLSKAIIPLADIYAIMKGVDDRDLVMAAVNEQPGILRDQYKYTYTAEGKPIREETKRIVPSYFLDDIGVMENAIKKDPEILLLAEDSIRDHLLENKNIAKTMIQTNGGNLEYTTEFQDDEGMVADALDTSNSAIRYASQRLRDNENLIRKSITASGVQEKVPGSNFQYASERLRGADPTSWPTTRALLQEALKTDPKAYTYLAPEYIQAPENAETLKEIISPQEIKKSAISAIGLGMESSDTNTLLANQSFFEKLSLASVHTNGDIKKLLNEQPQKVMEIVQSEIDRIEAEKPKGFIGGILNRKKKKAAEKQIALLNEFTNQVLITKSAYAGEKINRRKERDRQHDTLSKNTGRTT